MLSTSHNLMKSSDYLEIHFHQADNTHKCSNVKSVAITSQMFLNMLEYFKYMIKNDASLRLQCRNFRLDQYLCKEIKIFQLYYLDVGIN